jgi:hypothetical protein
MGIRGFGEMLLLAAAVEECKMPEKLRNPRKPTRDCAGGDVQHCHLPSILLSAHRCLPLHVIGTG